jgi:hypothetical protein
MVDLNTRLLGPVDLASSQIMAAIRARADPRPHAYDAATLRLFAEQAVAVTGLLGLRTSLIVGQMMHETAWLRFGGQVQPAQNNFAGLGATNNGAAGASFANVRDGILAVCVHHLAYIFGTTNHWPAGLDQFAGLDARLQAVLASGNAGTVTFMRDYTNGRWAFSPNFPVGSLDNGYAAGIVRAANVLLAQVSQEGQTMVPKIALTAGHHNKQGGDALEIEQTGKLTPAIARACRALGMDVRVFTPGDGAGFSTESLDVIARHVTEAAAAGWQADIYCETHSEGGPPGVFCLYPDVPGDVDTAVRDNLGPDLSRRVAQATGLGVRLGGRMSEQDSAVVSHQPGVRLGVFRVTEPLKVKTTRLILECGSHTNATEIAIMAAPGFYDRAGQAVAEAFATFLEFEPVVVAAEDPVSKRLNKWYESIQPLELQGDKSPATFHEVQIDFTGFPAGVPTSARGIVGEYIGGWYSPEQDQIFPLFPKDRAQLEATGKLTRR